MRIWMTKLIRYCAPALAAGLIAIFAGMGAASAAPIEPPDAGVRQAEIDCTDGLCALHVDLGAATPSWLPTAGVLVNVLEDNLHILPDGAGFEVRDDLVLEMPVGSIHLADAQIRLKVDGDNRVESFMGTAEVPLPSLGLLGNSDTRKPMAATVGFDRGDALPLAAAPLDPARKYLYFDLTSGAHLTAASGGGRTGDLSLTIPDGQRALAVIDPLERFVYVDGHVTLRYNGQIAFLAQLLDPTETVDLFAGELPLRHRATVHLTGAVTDEMDDTNLTLAGRYAVDAGRIGEWLKLEGEPLALEGSVVVTGAGLLATGIVRSSLSPQTVLDTAVQARVFVPFSIDYRDAYVELRSDFDMPAANIHADGYARLNGALDAVAHANVQLPWSGRDDAALAETRAKGSRGSDAGLWARAVAGYGWMSDRAVGGYESAAAGVEWSADLAARQWCGVTGRCGTQPVETAMR